MKCFISRLTRKIPICRDIYRAYKLLSWDKIDPQLFHPGHYMSPIPNLEEIKVNEARIFTKSNREFLGIDMNELEQLEMLKKLSVFYEELPFGPYKKLGIRYFFENCWYAYSDAIFLYSMICYARPNRIIEVGSGYSSCVILDTNDLFIYGKICCKFIDPNPERLLSVVGEEDRNSINLIPQRIQDVELGLFSNLSSGDILFIDTSHISKVGSDVNHLFFVILPILQKGVYIHIHDIYFPFESPKDRVLFFGEYWNEVYLLRAFLQYNNEFKIVLFNTYLEEFYQEFFEENMPMCLINKGGSIWLQRT